jgi:hypothetical protein
MLEFKLKILFLFPISDNLKLNPCNSVQFSALVNILIKIFQATFEEASSHFSMQLCAVARAHFICRGPRALIASNSSREVLSVCTLLLESARACCDSINIHCVAENSIARDVDASHTAESIIRTPCVVKYVNDPWVVLHVSWLIRFI